MKRFVPLLLALLAFAFAKNPASAAVNFTLSQPAMSNLFTGSIDLQVTGLTNGEPVLLQKFLDANGNGSVDGGELLLAEFKLVEGQVSRIAGVRNRNVPGDEDETADGVINETFDFSDPTDFRHHVGAYLFRVSSPTANFSPIIRPFSVTNSTIGQAVTGTVTGVPHALVIMLKANGNGGEPFVGGFTDAAGAFNISCPPGSYQAIAAKPGMVTDFGAGPSVTVNAGVNANVTLSIATANQTFTGTLTNAVTGGVLAGVQVRMQSATGLFSLGYTDSQGVFTVGLTPGQWTLEVDEDALAALGFVQPAQQSDYDTSTGVPAGVVIPVQPATALFYGTFRDGGTLNGIAAMLFEARVQNGGPSGKGLTDAAGNYSVGVVAGTWSVGPDNDALVARGILASSTNTTIANGQAIRLDFASRTVTAHLTGQVLNDLGAPLSNFTLVVQPVPLSGGGANSYYPSTDGSGNFDIGLSAGTWNIHLESQQAASSNLVSFSIDRVVVDNVNQAGLVFVAYRSTQQITGFVREGSTGITNVQLYGGMTLNGTNYISPASYTDSNGNYGMKVMNGSWTVQLNNFDINQRGYFSPNNQTVPISNAPGNANFSLTRYSNIITLGNLSRVGNQFTVQATGDTGRNYVLEVTTNLRSPISWTPVSTNSQNGANFQATDNSATGPARYYRMRVLQP
jgi:hypothetical protein